MEALLVNAPVKKNNRHSRLAPPLGLLYIISTLRHSGYTAKIIDFNIDGLDIELLRSACSKGILKSLAFLPLQRPIPMLSRLPRPPRNWTPM